MDEVLELQQKLAAAQVSNSAAKLSERNCIELVAKLQSLSLVDLVFTRSGKEYLTRAQLVKEIEDEVLVRGGRVNVIDLPDALNMDLAHIHAAVPSMLEAVNASHAEEPTKGKSSQPFMQVVNGEIVTKDYLASLAAEVDASLEASATGVENIGEIATRTDLPVDVVRSCIAEHVGTTIRATLDESTGVLRSHASAERSFAAARGALRGLASPTMLGEIAEKQGAQLAIVQRACTELLEKGVLKGAVEGHGPRALFTPAVYERAAKASVMQAFARGNFITMDVLRCVNVTDPTSFAKEYVPGSLVAGETIVGAALMETVESSAIEAIENSSWLDIPGALPPDFPADDVRHLIDLLNHTGKSPPSGKATSVSTKGSKASKRKQAKASDSVTQEKPQQRVALSAPVLHDEYLVSSSILDQCRSAIEKDANQRADTRAAKLVELRSIVGAKPQVADSTPGNAESNPKKGGKAKGRRRKDKSETDPQSTSDARGGEASSVPIDVPTFEEVCEILTEQPDFRNVLESDYLGNAPSDENELLAAIVKGAVDATAGFTVIYENAASRAVVELEKAREASRMRLEKSLLSDLETAEVFANTADSLSAVSEAMVQASRKHVAETVCAGIALTTADLLANSAGVPGSDVDADAKDMPVVQRARRVCERLPAEVAGQVRTLLSSAFSTSDKDVREFLSAYDECASLPDLPERRPLDKKRERAACANMRAAMMQRAMDESADSPMAVTDALLVVSTLSFARTSSGAMVSLSPQDSFVLCEWLEQNARPEELRAPLADLKAAILDELRQQDGAAKAPVVSADIRVKVQAVMAIVAPNQQ